MQAVNWIEEIAPFANKVDEHGRIEAVLELNGYIAKFQMCPTASIPHCTRISIFETGLPVIKVLTLSRYSDCTRLAERFFEDGAIHANIVLEHVLV